MRGGTRPGAGNPGYGIVHFVMGKVKEFSPKWWDTWEEIMDNGNKDDKRFAMSEFNRIQMKCMPQEVKLEDTTKRIELQKEDITLLTWLASGLRERLKNQECLPSPKSLDISKTIVSTDSLNSITSKQKKVMT